MFLPAAVTNNNAVLMLAEQPTSSTSDDGLQDINILTTIAPYSKADPKSVRRKTRQQKSSVITDTANKLKRFLNLAKNSSESEEEEEIISESDQPESSDEEEERLTDNSPMKRNCSNNILAILPTGTFVVAKIYCTSQNFKKFIAQIVDGPNKENDYEVKFMKRSLKVKDGFIFPKIELASISHDDIICVLPIAKPVAHTTRLSGIFKFLCEVINNEV